MTEPFRPPSASSETASQHELIVPEKFDYTRLDPEIVRQVQPAVQRIQKFTEQMLGDVIAIGNELLAVKAALPHGSFGPWLRAEIDLSERSARNFMRVAAGFGCKTASVADLHIEPTAAYLLVAPTTPDEAMMEALRRAETGETIAASVAREILNTRRKKPERRKQKLPVELPPHKLWGQLLDALESIRPLWKKEELPTLARELREYAEFVEHSDGNP